MAEDVLPDASFIYADWPAPHRVRALTTTRIGGTSRGTWSSLDLASHCGDDLAAVHDNRRALRRSLHLATDPTWLEQVHGCGVQQLPRGGTPRADAAWTDQPGVICTILTADCLPVLLCDVEGQVVAAAHAGWRGLAGGVLEATVTALPVPAQRLMAWLGPCIGPTAFEVGEEVRAAFCACDPRDGTAFVPATRPWHWWADLPELARCRLARLGVSAIYGGRWCTFSDARRFFSYRRERRTGRMASLIWLERA